MTSQYSYPLSSSSADVIHWLQGPQVNGGGAESAIYKNLPRF